MKTSLVYIKKFVESFLRHQIIPNEAIEPLAKQNFVPGKVNIFNINKLLYAESKK